jgi:CYTH domain-containing protein/CHAD domain-containing protein
VAAEIERKFLLGRLPGDLDRYPSKRIEQGYLAISKQAEVRLRRADEERTLTVKRGSGEAREEIEVELGPEQFEALWDACGEDRLEKRRHLVPLGESLTAEVDVYGGSLAGLLVAEVEFSSAEAARAFEPPTWFGREVTGERGYVNQSLARSGTPDEVSPDDVSSDRGRSYGLAGDEELAAGLTRIAAGRAEKALERLRESSAGETETADAVHGARKDMKKLRTVLRLLRDELGSKLYQQENARFRDAARALSETRDAEAKLDSLDALVEQEEELPEEAVESWRKILDRDREAATNAARDEPAVAEAISLIEEGLESIREWDLEGDSWKLIDAGITRSYRRGRRAMKAARKNRGEGDFHEWRKRAKDLWYELRLLSAAWNAPLEATAEEAHDLTDLLGDHHDLAVLREDLGERNLGEGETVALEAAIDRRQEALAVAAFTLGRRLYAERPQDFSRRLRRYWEAWRG